MRLPLFWPLCKVRPLVEAALEVVVTNWRGVRVVEGARLESV